MFTPSNNTNDTTPAARPDPAAIVRQLAEKHGVRPLDHTGPMQVLDPVQAAQARGYVQFRGAHPVDDPDAPDPVTARRGARILMAREGAMLREKVWGLSADPADEDAADFSDVAAVLDEVATQIHGPRPAP